MLAPRPIRILHLLPTASGSAFALVNRNAVFQVSHSFWGTGRELTIMSIAHLIPSEEVICSALCFHEGLQAPSRHEL